MTGGFGGHGLAIERHLVGFQARSLFFYDDLSGGPVGGRGGIIIHVVCADLPGNLGASGETTRDGILLGARGMEAEQKKGQAESQAGDGE